MYKIRAILTSLRNKQTNKNIESEEEEEEAEELKKCIPSRYLSHPRIEKGL